MDPNYKNRFELFSGRFRFPFAEELALMRLRETGLGGALKGCEDRAV